jgi:hypothetical protein
MGKSLMEAKMGNEERSLKDCLIQGGLWEEGEGDPLADNRSLGLLLDRVQGKFASGVLVVFYEPIPGSEGREIRVALNGYQRTLTTGANITEAICKAALILPEFLQQHPEYGTH